VKRSCTREIRRSGHQLIIRGPVELGGKRISACATLQRPRADGHDYEGRVTIKGKSYSAFTSGGVDDFVIVARSRK
jgi:hypothetical protein